LILNEQNETQQLNFEAIDWCSARDN
jgi:hypothetical protein